MERQIFDSTGLSVKVCRLLSDGRIEWRQFKTAQEAAARASRWWGEKDSRAVVVFHLSGKEDSRYERPGFDESHAPDGFPRRSAKQVRPDPPVIKPADPEFAEPTVPMFDDGKMQADAEAAAAQAVIAPGPNRCDCCVSVLVDGPHPGEGRDRTPTGRSNDRRCPACGAPWPVPGAKGWDILRRYVGTRQGGARVVESGPTVHARLHGWPK